MSNIFNSVQYTRPRKNKFDLSHERKMSMKMGTLTPFLLQEIMPGDKFRVNTEMLLRLQPLLAPIMHRVRVKTDFFFVPNRLVWDNWQKFITGGDKGTDASVHPYIPIDSTSTPELWGKGSLADYLGIPAIATGNLTHTEWINALPFRAYQLIYNEYYRDQTLIDPIAINTTDGLDGSATILELRKRAWEKDYFTSCQPQAQKGGAVELPTDIQYKAGGSVLRNIGGGAVDAPLGALTGVEANPPEEISGRMQAPNSGNISIENIESIGTTINDLRISVRLQEWLEKNARAGSRYIESILAHFGVLSSDARLQRPEYLGGGVNPVVISEVLSTFQNADDSGYPQGTMSGHGISTGNVHGFSKSFEEHGYVFGIMTILPRTTYQQGIPKTFFRFNKFDYAWPSFAQLGEQEVKNKELFFLEADPSNSNNGAFGYQARYAEYKYQPSTVHGDFKDNLAFWHMGRIFTAQPQLNESFITADPTKRVFAVEEGDVDEILVQLYNRIDAVRPLPYFNNPTL